MIIFHHPRGTQFMAVKINSHVWFSAWHMASEKWGTVHPLQKNHLASAPLLKKLARILRLPSSSALRRMETEWLCLWLVGHTGGDVELPKLPIFEKALDDRHVIPILHETVIICHPNTHVTEALGISVTENICGFIFSVIVAENPQICDFLLQLFVYVIPGVGELGAQGWRRLARRPWKGTEVTCTVLGK